jgi:hypothetical protein
MQGEKTTCLSPTKGGHTGSLQTNSQQARARGLGFRDMRLFNQVLLAKHVWRLIERPNNLCARVLKAKYYPNGELLDTTFPTIQSPTWRAIVHGLDLLKQGVCWQIWRGSSVRIWRVREFLGEGLGRQLVRDACVA